MTSPTNAAVPSREQLLHSLYEAAELEHNLMCTYLYAAFSLKQGEAEGLAPREAEAVERWRREITAVAVEEMGHLVAVWNITAALGGGQHQRYADDPNVLGLPETTADGNGILGHVFGSKDVSREVATRAAAQTGISEGVLKSMLPVVAAMMMGTMSRQSQPGSQQAGPGAGGGSLLDMLAPMLYANRNGSMVDDVIGMLGRFTKG